MIVAGRGVEVPWEREADVVVVGTGAGGGMLARELAAAGLEVVALEEGAHLTARDFSMREEEMLEGLFQEGGGRATTDLQIRVLQGRGVGGSTVHNTNLCKRTPAEVLEEWGSEYGVVGASAEDLEDDFARTESDLSVHRIGGMQVNANNGLFRRGVEALGYRGGALAHNRQGCRGSGFCELGCPFDAKQNSLKVLIPQAVGAGATVLSDARVERVSTRADRVVGVSGVVLGAGGEVRGPFRVRARAVCLAGSAVGSAALHLASGLPDRSGQVGRNLRLHPGAVVAGLFGEEVRGWEGVPQSWECTEFLDLRPGSNRRVWLVPVFAHPIGTATMIPGFGREHAALMRKFPYVAALTAMVHDASAGRVRVRRSGRVRLDYTLNRSDRYQLTLGLREGARILLAAGAERVLVPYTSGPLWLRDPSELEAVDRRGVPPFELPLTAVHPMGTLRMGEDPRRAVVDSWGAHHAVRGLYVGDGSLFPTSIGVPPQISIYTFARRVARRVVADLG